MSSDGQILVVYGYSVPVRYLVTLRLYVILLAGLVDVCEPISWTFFVPYSQLLGTGPKDRALGTGEVTLKVDYILSSSSVGKSYD